MTDNRTYIQKKSDALKLYILWHYLSKQFDIILVAEYPKSGGTWLCQMLSAALEIPFPRNRSPKFEQSILHAHYLHDKGLNKIVHQVRDGRDVMISLYHHMYFGNGIISNEVLEKFRERAPFKNFDDIQKNLPAYIEYMFTKFTISNKQVNWSDFINSYRDKENVIHVKYEDLLLQPEHELQRILFELNENEYARDPQRIKTIVMKNSFEVQSKRKRGDENKTHFLRKGIAGDWKNQFTKEASQVFNYYAGKELITAGYEKDSNWF